MRGGANNPVPFGSPEGSAHWTRAQTEAGGAVTPLRALPAICDTDGFDIGLIWPQSLQHSAARLAHRDDPSAPLISFVHDSEVA